MGWIIDNMYWIFSGFGVVLFGVITSFCIKYYKRFTNKSKEIHLQTVDIADTVILKRLIEDSTEIKIFTSASETARMKLTGIFKEIHMDKKKTIKILIRHDGSEQRDNKINDEIRKWSINVESICNQMVNFEFGRYVQKEGSVMLRGYIFDNNYAILGWYLNTIEHRYGAENPMVLYSHSHRHQTEIIKFAVQTFDYFFEKREV